VITTMQLHLIMPRCPEINLASYAGYLGAALISGNAITVTRASAFIAHLAHESGELRWWEEIAEGNAYEGREDLGNTESGDGPRYKGHGPIQITGRANHKACGDALGLDLLADPQLLCTPEVGFRGAMWFWNVGAGLRLSRAAQKRVPVGSDLNVIADIPDFVATTLAVNGGTNGLDQRLAYYHRALEVLGIVALWGTRLG